MSKHVKETAVPANENKAAEQVNESTAPAAETSPALVTVNDLVLIVKFLEELANMKRLSEFEIQGVKPSFDRIVAFLSQHQQQITEANSQDAVAQVEETLLDLPVTKGKSKKKEHKKK